MRGTYDNEEFGIDIYVDNKEFDGKNAANEGLKWSESFGGLLTVKDLYLTLTTPRPDAKDAQARAAWDANAITIYSYLCYLRKGTARSLVRQSKIGQGLKKGLDKNGVAAYTKLLPAHHVYQLQEGRHGGTRLNKELETSDLLIIGQKGSSAATVITEENIPGLPRDGEKEHEQLDEEQGCNDDEEKWKFTTTSAQRNRIELFSDEREQSNNIVLEVQQESQNTVSTRLTGNKEDWVEDNTGFTTQHMIESADHHQTDVVPVRNGRIRFCNGQELNAIGNGILRGIAINSEEGQEIPIIVPGLACNQLFVIQITEIEGGDQAPNSTGIFIEVKNNQKVPIHQVMGGLPKIRISPKGGGDRSLTSIEDWKLRKSKLQIPAANGKEEEVNPKAVQDISIYSTAAIGYPVEVGLVHEATITYRQTIAIPQDESSKDDGIYNSEKCHKKFFDPGGKVKECHKKLHLVRRMKIVILHRCE
jgi:hypothetical protein